MLGMRRSRLPCSDAWRKPRHRRGRQRELRPGERNDRKRARVAQCFGRGPLRRDHSGRESILFSSPNGRPGAPPISESESVSAMRPRRFFFSDRGCASFKSSSTVASATLLDWVLKPNRRLYSNTHIVSSVFTSTKRRTPVPANEVLPAPDAAVL